MKSRVINDKDDNKARTYATPEDDVLNKRGWVRLIRIGKDKYNRLIIKAKDTMNKLRKIEENGERKKGVSKNEWNGFL